MLFVYFLGGFLYLKYYKHQEGTDAVPHYKFWKDLPAKVKVSFCTYMAEILRYLLKGDKNNVDMLLIRLHLVSCV